MIAGAGSAPPWTPASVSDIQGWFDATDGPEKDSGGWVPCTNGDGVGRWRDKSGNDYHALQATAGHQPIFRTGIQNGLPGVDFDGLATEASATISFGEAITTTTFVLGAWFNGGNTLSLNGNICELIVYSRALDSAERSSVRTYLKDK